MPETEPKTPTLTFEKEYGIRYLIRVDGVRAGYIDRSPMNEKVWLIDFNPYMDPEGCGSVASAKAQVRKAFKGYYDRKRGEDA